MSTKIQWTDETINPIVGCSKISPGCENCYAAVAAKSARLQQFPQYQKVKEWNGTFEFVEKQLMKPFEWRSPKRIFVCSMSDFFHKKIPLKWRIEIFAVMALCPQHKFQILTKRPEWMYHILHTWSYETKIEVTTKAIEIAKQLNLRDQYGDLSTWSLFQPEWPLSNVWYGVTIENQQAAEIRIPLLLKTPAKVRFLSCEPLLEEIDLTKWISLGIDWIIIGGESGINARKCKAEWVRSIITQAESAKIPVFVKQLGSNNDLLLKNKADNILDFPLDLQLRNFPNI